MQVTIEVRKLFWLVLILVQIVTQTAQAQDLKSLDSVTLQRYKAARAMAISGDSKQALAAFHGLIKSHKRFAAFYRDRGAVYLQLKEWKKATNDLSKAISLEPNLPEVYNLRGTAYYKREKYRKAIRDFREVIARFPTSDTAYTNMGNCYFARERWEDAIDAYAKALTLASASPAARFGFANTLCKVNRYEEAVQHYAILINQHPNHWQFWHNMGLAYIESQDYTHGLLCMDYSVNLNSSNAEAWYLRGKCQYETAKYALACRDWAKAAQAKHKLSKKMLDLYCGKKR